MQDTNASMLNSKRVLVIEDDEEDYMIIEDLLSQSQFQQFHPTWAQNYDQAISALEKREHDICMIDYRLGEYNGLELLKRAPISSQEIPAIVLTGYDDPEIDIQAMNAGAADYLEKAGLNSRMLERAIRYTLSKANSEKELRRSQERYALAAAGSNDGLWDWDLLTQTIYFSERWLDMLGYVKEPFNGSVENWFSAIHPKDLPGLRNAINSHLNKKTSFLRHTYRIRHSDGHYLWMQCRGKAVRDKDGVAQRIAGSQADITKQKEIEEELAKDALHDPLTGMANKAMLLEHLRATLAERSDQRASCAVLFMDLDDFKEINDTFGHDLGDRLLVKLAHRIKSILRMGDIIARFGGDEFVVFLKNLKDKDQATQSAQRILDILAAPFKFGDQELFVSCSIGLAYITPDDIRNVEDILRDADIALYEAKHDGKSKHKTFNKKMRDKAVKIVKIKTDLKKALPGKEMKLFYQPIFLLKEKELVGFEALLRWDKPGQGMVYPGNFIPLAEQSGIIVDIGQWVFQEGCKQLHKWHTELPGSSFYLSMNLSPRQLADPDLVTKYENIIQQTGVDRKCLKIEITETSMMHDEEKARNQLSRFQQLGINVYMDDFGTGYSSLSMLHEFPIDVLKIDQSFIRRINPKNNQGQRMISSILAIAEIFNLDVIAEGIETEYQADLLERYGCNYAQGYHFVKPVDAASAFKYLEANFSSSVSMG